MMVIDGQNLFQGAKQADINYDYEMSVYELLNEECEELELSRNAYLQELHSGGVWKSRFL